jgi:hypothetical protein
LCSDYFNVNNNRNRSPLEDNKRKHESETKSPMIKTLSEEEPSSTTVSKEELSERSAEVQQGNTAES